MTLTQRVNIIKTAFDAYDGCQANADTKYFFNQFPEAFPELADDMFFCFEVLAGKHKLGYTYYGGCSDNWRDEYDELTIRQAYNLLRTDDHTEDALSELDAMFKEPMALFFSRLANREYRLGYSGKNNMIKNTTPMLAKKYPDHAKHDFYFIQEKLDGNRCIAAYDEGREQWEFWSRSGKKLNVEFDMSWAPKHFVFDGEIMTKDHAETRDFGATQLSENFSKLSGAINSKYGDKKNLVYYIYDLVEELGLPYKDRKLLLERYVPDGHIGNVALLPVIGYVFNSLDNRNIIDNHLGAIIEKGGEGIMLRAANGIYEHKRSGNLLKYKDVQTMDLRVVGTLEGRGKYNGQIGALICEDDEHTIHVDVGSGLSDAERALHPSLWIGRIVEVQYFARSRARGATKDSLRFPRFKGVRHDKSDTSIY